MAEYGKIYKKFWYKSLPSEVRLLYLYIIANEHSNIIGLYRLPLAYIGVDLGWPRKVVEDAMHELGDLVEYDFEANVVFIPSWFQYNLLVSSNHLKRAILELRELPDTHLYLQYYEMLKKLEGDYYNDLAIAVQKKIQALENEIKNSFERNKNPFERNQKSVRTKSKTRSNSSTSTCTYTSTKRSKRSLRKKEICADKYFAQFWDIYPRKRGKEQAMKTWTNLKPSADLAKEIIAAIKKINEYDFSNRVKSKIPYPSTWLNAKGWLDEVGEDEHAVKVNEIPKWKREANERAAAVRANQK